MNIAEKYDNILEHVNINYDFLRLTGKEDFTTGEKLSFLNSIRIFLQEFLYDDPHNFLRDLKQFSRHNFYTENTEEFRNTILNSIERMLKA